MFDAGRALFDPMLWWYPRRIQKIDNDAFRGMAVEKKPTTSTDQEKQSGSSDTPSRRDFLILASGAVGAVGAGAFAWPFIKSMNPAADVLALSAIDVDLKPIAEGQAITVMWRGKPLFIRHRTPQEIKDMSLVPLSHLKDPQTDGERFQQNPKWLVVVGVCTHLGCVPSGQKPSDNHGHYGGWFCPCHGSEYDLSGRIRQGPAPRNLEVPPYRFLNDTTIRVG